MEIKNIKKVFAILPFLILASCTSDNNSVSDLDEDIVNTGEVADSSNLSEEDSNETLNENIQKTEFAKGRGFGGKQYRGGDTNSRAS